jgi:hypothetical protein
MPISTLQNCREQNGVVQFNHVVNHGTIKRVSWRSNGSALEIWAQNNGNNDVEISFDGGFNFFTLPSGGVDVYREKTIELWIRRKTGTGSNIVNFKILTADTNPKPTLAVGQKDDGKVR